MNNTYDYQGHLIILYPPDKLPYWAYYISPPPGKGCPQWSTRAYGNEQQARAAAESAVDQRIARASS